MRSINLGTKLIKVNTLSYKTVSANKETVEKEWFIVDANDVVLGRLASVVAVVLRGKHKPSFTPHVDCGDKVIVINAEKIKLTGNKMTDKQYVRHSGYPAIKGMLPKSRLGSEMFRNLFVYAGANHPHEAQQPKTLDLNKIK